MRMRYKQATVSNIIWYIVSLKAGVVSADFARGIDYANTMVPPCVAAASSKVEASMLEERFKVGVGNIYSNSCLNRILV